MSSGRQPHIRISLFAKRKPGISSEDFHKHWSTIHADVVRNLPGYLEICHRYVQFHALPEYQNQEKVMGIPVLQFDGIVEIWVNGVDEYQRHMSRADIIEVLYADEKNFISREDAMIMVGYETLEIGDAVPGFVQSNPGTKS